MPYLRTKLIRLAHAKPELRADLLPLLTRRGSLSRKFKGYTLVPQPLKAGIQWTVLAFDRAGEEVGFLHYFPAKYKGEIANLGVKPEHQRKGLASAMFDYAVDIAGTVDNVSGETRPAPTHSTKISDEGAAWKKSLFKG